VYADESAVTPTAAAATVEAAAGKVVDSADANTKAVKAQTNNLTRFQKALENLKDWVEVRLQRREERIALYEARSENRKKYQTKNA